MTTEQIIAAIKQNGEHLIKFTYAKDAREAKTLYEKYGYTCELVPKRLTGQYFIYYLKIKNK